MFFKSENCLSDILCVYLFWHDLLLCQQNRTHDTIAWWVHFILINVSKGNVYQYKSLVSVEKFVYFIKNLNGRGELIASFEGDQLNEEGWALLRNELTFRWVKRKSKSKVSHLLRKAFAYFILYNFRIWWYVVCSIRCHTSSFFPLWWCRWWWWWLLWLFILF